jgi:Flp pilus assembly protein TadG
MRRNRSGKRHLQQDSESGAAAVEFALVIPLLLLILCGIFDLGNLYFQMDVVNEAARQGARLAAVNLQTSSQITTALQGSYGNQLTVSENPSAPIAGSNVTVTVTSNVTILTPLISAFFSKNPYPVSGQCVMYVE